jgi:DNA-binding beta-propeller fold protein YncE
MKTGYLRRSPGSAPWVVALFAVLLLAQAIPSGAQQIDLAEANAREEFRFGVQAYHATRYNDAIVAFNRALAFVPDDLRTREWLGRAYFRAGLEDAALAEWDNVVSEGGAGAYLISFLDTIRYRRGVLPFLDGEISLSRSQLLRARMGEAQIFHRPSGVAAGPGGDVFVVSLGTREILRITPNGRVRARLRGGLEGLDNPLDVAIHDDLLYVTEFSGDRVSVLNMNGGRELSFGSSGLDEGQLLGPQYLAVDPSGFVYVSEWATRRVSKFSVDGEFLLTMGARSTGDSRLARPTGVAVRDGTVYVADFDDEGAALKLFDDSGNYLRRIPLPLDASDAPAHAISGSVVEDLEWYDPERLLVNAGAKTLLFDLVNEAVDAVIDDAERVRVSSAVRDANGRVVVTDFDADQIGIFEPEGTLYSGLDVRIERVVTRSFPEIAIQVAVHDRDGRPLLGLTEENFVVSEMGVPRQDARVESSSRSVQALDTVVLIQPRSGEQYRMDAAQAVADLVTLRDGGDRLSVLLAGDQTRLIDEGGASTEGAAANVRAALAEFAPPGSRDGVALDMGLRAAATRLLDRDLRRDIILLGDGRVGDGAFSRYGIEEVAGFLRENGIRLHLITLSQVTPDREIEYLIAETGGSMRYLYEPEGLRPMVEELREAPGGRYWLSLLSQEDTDFGRRYISLSVEARLFVRSGRDEIGCFGPASP